VEEHIKTPIKITILKKRMGLWAKGMNLLILQEICTWINKIKANTDKYQDKSPYQWAVKKWIITLILNLISKNLDKKNRINLTTLGLQLVNKAWSKMEM